MKPDKLSIDFEPLGKRIEANQGDSLLVAAQKAGIDLIAVCGGSGTCKQCQVQIITGKISDPNLIEKKVFNDKMLREGWRLACQVDIQISLKVHIPPDSLSTPQRLQTEGITEIIPSVPLYTFQNFVLSPSEDTSIDDKLSTKIHSIATDQIWSKQTTQKAFLKAASAFDNPYKFVTRNGKIVNYISSQDSALGLAIDLGTTKIAAYLVNMETNEIAAKASAPNPQITYGEDVVSRILYCMEHPNGEVVMQKKVVEAINKLVVTMLANIYAKSDQIIETVVVGNTAMHHLFANLPVRQLGLAPYTPAVRKAIKIDPTRIGLHVSPFSIIYLPENIAGYVGGDHVAMMIATGVDQSDDCSIALDIGTNTEISLNNHGTIYTCSCASGPTFEGAHIQDGMRAADGAIERIRIDSDEIQYQTIGNVPAIGICGSGILDAIAEMKRNYIITNRGNFLSHDSIRENGNMKELVLAYAKDTGCDHDIVVTRKDINEILLAKAAIQSGIDVLLRTAGITAIDLDRFLVAGAFGTYLNIESAIQIGMFPSLPAHKFQQVGNAAGTGARMMLVSDQFRKWGKKLAKQAHYVELTSYPDFQKIYIDALKI